MRKKNKPFLSSQSGRFGSGSSSFGSNVRSPLLALPAPNTGWKTKPNTPTNAPMRKQLTQKEYQEKRAQLCFYRDQKYTRVHICSGQLFSLVVLANEMEFVEEIEEEEMTMSEEVPQISLNALNGANSFQTIRITGKVGKHEVNLLVDCGSTHNFLDVI